MKIRILALGRPRLPHAMEAVEEYRKRLARRASVEVAFVKEKGAPRNLLDRSSGTWRIALDERGESLTTRGFVEMIDTLERRGDIKAVSFLIGGADGHAAEVREESDLVLSLSPLTLQHELALVVLLEQLYRVYSIKRGEPYHRE